MCKAFTIHIETSPLICSANQWTGFYMNRKSLSHTSPKLQKGVVLFDFFIDCMSETNSSTTANNITKQYFPHAQLKPIVLLILLLINIAII